MTIYPTEMDALDLETGPKLWWLPNFFHHDANYSLTPALKMSRFLLNCDLQTGDTEPWMRQNGSMGVGLRSLRNDGPGASLCWTL